MTDRSTANALQLVAGVLFERLTPALADQLRLKAVDGGVAKVSAANLVFYEIGLEARQTMLQSALAAGLTIQRIDVSFQGHGRTASFAPLNQVLDGIPLKPRPHRSPGAGLGNDKPVLPTSVIQHAQRLQQLAGRLIPALPQPLPAHVRLGNLREDGVLVLLTTSPAWSARVRMDAGRILQIATGLGLQVKEVRAKVVLDPRPPGDRT